MKKTELSRTSTKRAKLIKEGLKTNGTFTIDVASIRARQGAMSSKVADAVFGKAKGRKKSGFKPRKPTGEAALFLTIWDNLPHECEVCKVPINEAKAPPVNELTTEERLAEAVGLLDELLISAGAAYSNKADYNITRYYRCAKEVSTFLKSIKP